MYTYYYDVTIHHGVANNICYDTRVKSGFETLEEAIQWAAKHWNAPITLKNVDDPLHVGEVAREWIDETFESYDMLLIRRLPRRVPA